MYLSSTSRLFYQENQSRSGCNLTLSVIKRAQALEVPGPGPYGQQSPTVTLQLLIAFAGFFMYKLAVVGVSILPPPERPLPSRPRSALPDKRF